jgi:DNA adenine methylase
MKNANTTSRTTGTTAEKTRGTTSRSAPPKEAMPIPSASRLKKKGSLANAKPFLKWAGGKWKLMPQLEKSLPQSFKNYYEPFMGSAAFFFWMKAHNKIPKNSVVTLMDLNEELVICFKEVQGPRYKRLITLLKQHEKKHLAANNQGATGKSHYYYSVRDTIPHDKTERAARFIYLNRTCFNGLWRVNRAGKFNVPMGRYKNPAICNPSAIEAAHFALKGVKIKRARNGYKAIERKVTKDDFVYLDPPYVPLTKTAAFTSYTSEGFGPEDQKELARFAQKIAKRGAKVLISNSDTKESRALYSGRPFETDPITARRAIGRKADSRIAVSEIAVRTYERKKGKKN